MHSCDATAESYLVNYRDLSVDSFQFKFGSNILLLFDYVFFSQENSLSKYEALKKYFMLTTLLK